MTENEEIVINELEEEPIVPPIEEHKIYEVVLEEKSLNQLKNFKNDKEFQVTTYFSILIGLIIGYIFAKGLWANWKS